MCLHSAGLKSAVRVEEADGGGSDWVLRCTGVDSGDEAEAGGGFDGGVAEVASTSMVVAEESFWRFEVVAVVEEDSWDARRATMLLPRLPPREPFGGVMVEVEWETKNRIGSTYVPRVPGRRKLYERRGALEAFLSRARERQHPLKDQEYTEKLEE